MSNHPYQYPEDLTGANARNLVQNEDHEIPTRYERIFVPAGGPFFTTTLRIVDVDTGRQLVPVTDFKCLHLQNEATLDSGKQVCCVIVILNDNVDHARIRYQAVGGKYGEVVTTLREIVDDIDWDKITRVSWGSNIYGKPEVYPPARHRHPPDDFTGWMRTIKSLHDIYHALIIKDGAAWESVYAFINHQIELGRGQFYTNVELDDRFSDLQTLINSQPIHSKAARNLVTLNPDGIYFNDNYRLVNPSNNYILTLADIGTRTIVRMNTASLKNCTVPIVGTSIPIGTIVSVRQMAAEVAVVGASGVTLQPSKGNKVVLDQPGSTLTLVYTGLDTWDAMMMGSLGNAIVVAPPVVVPPVVTPPVVTPPVSPYDIMAGYAFNITSTINVTPQVGSTVTFTAVNKDYRNRPVTFHVNWGLRDYTRISGDTGLSGGNIYVNGRTDANGSVTISATLPGYDKLPKQWQAGTHMYIAYDIYATEDMNPPYPPAVENKVFFTMAGLVDLKANVQISARGRVSYVHYNGRLNLPKAPIDTVTPISELTLEMQDLVTSYGSGSAKFEMYTTSFAKTLLYTGEAFIGVPYGSSVNTQPSWNGNTFVYRTDQWMSRNPPTFVQPYFEFKMTLPNAYDPAKHILTFTSATAKHRIVGQNIFISLLGVYRDVSRGSTRYRYHDIPSNIFNIKITNKGN